MRVGVASGLLVVLVGCGPSRTLDPAETEPVRIGVVLSLSGSSGTPGPDRLAAIRMAVREVNSAGGVLPGRQVELVVQDSESMEAIAVSGAQEAVAAGAVAVIGDSPSRNTIAIYQMVTQPMGVLQASGSSTSTRLTDIQAMLSPSERWFFRTAPSDVGQAPALAGAMASRGCMRAAFVYVDDAAYGRPLYEAARSVFAASGSLRTEFGQPIVDGLADYSEQAMAVAGAMPAPDCVALIAYPGSGGRFVQAWSRIATRPSVTWFGTDALRQPGFVEEAGGSNVDGFLGTAPITDPATPAYNAFANAFRATYGRAPVTTFSANFYDATALILLAIAKTGELDRARIRDAIRELADPMGIPVRAGNLAEGVRLLRQGRAINYDGASGPVDVDGLGDVEGIFEVWAYDHDTMRFERIETLLPE